MRLRFSNGIRIAIRLVVIGCATVAWHLAAYGQTNSWINPTSGKWENASSWSLGTAPGIGDSADLITNAGNSTVTNDATTASGFPATMVISNLTISAPSGSTNTLVLSNLGTVTPFVIHNSVSIGPGGVLVMTNSLLSLDGATDGVIGLDSSAILYDSTLLLNTNVAMTVGSVGTGTLSAAGGTNTLFGDVYVGYQTNSVGSVVLAAGQLVTSNGNMVVGFYGSGQIIVSNGILMSVTNIVTPPTGILLGATASANGTLTVLGGTCLENGHLDLGEELGSTGRVWVSNGQLIVTNGYLISIGGNGVGQMVVSNSQMSAYNVGVANGPASQGTLTIVGGTTTFSGGLIVGGSLGATGSVSVTSGQLTVNNQTIIVGSYGVGQMTVSNSSLLARAIKVGNGLSSCGTLTFAGSTTATVSNIVAGAYSNSTGVIQLTGGSLGVTNQSGTGNLVIGQLGQGILTQNGGSLTVDQLLVINGTNSQFNFNAGSLASKSTTVSNTQTFVVGDGFNAATFRLLGGIHTFSNGLRVRSNAMLVGCGTINGAVVVDAGGTITSTCGAGTMLTFTGILTNNGVLLAVNGGTLEFYGPVVNNGLINAFSGNTNFHAGLVNNGVVLTSNTIPQIVSISVTGSDVNLQFTTFSNLTHYVEYNSNLVNGSWIALTGFTGTGGIMSHTDPGAATLTQRFYRVHLVVPQ
jgi:T5SS/PEP-CTERM-associated repeat protein